MQVFDQRNGLATLSSGKTRYPLYSASLHEKQRTQIQDMLPQQYYNEKSSYF